MRLLVFITEVMAFLNAYIVFIIKTTNGYIIGLTSDIDEVINEHRSKNLGANLVFQQHFDDLDKARCFEDEIKNWSDSKKELLIRGER